MRSPSASDAARRWATAQLSRIKPLHDQRCAQLPRPELCGDEVREVAGWLAVDGLTVAATLSHLWRHVALELLRALWALRPAGGPQCLARNLKAKDPTFCCHVPSSGSSEVAVAESNQHRICLVSAETGERLRCIGSFGNQAAGAGLNYPKGVACSADGAFLFVADRSNHRVVKLAMSDGALVASVGGRGFGEGRLKYPQGLALAAQESLLFVCDYGNDRVVGLDARTLEWLFTLGEGLGENFALPSGCAASDATSELAVVDGRSQVVHLFSTAGERRHLRTLCEGRLEYPWGVAFSADGQRLVLGEGAPSGGRRGRLQVVDARTGGVLQLLVLPDHGRVSGVCVDSASARVFAVDHDERAVRTLTSVWPGLEARVQRHLDPG